MIGRLDDINKNCSKWFQMHWKCLDNNNQQLWHCRRFEQALNACVSEKLVRRIPTSLPRPLHTSSSAYEDVFFPTQKLEKTIPGAPENETPVHLRDRQIFSDHWSSLRTPDRGRKPITEREAERRAAERAADKSGAK